MSVITHLVQQKTCVKRDMNVCKMQMQYTLYPIGAVLFSSTQGEQVDTLKPDAPLPDDSK